MSMVNIGDKSFEIQVKHAEKNLYAVNIRHGIYNRQIMVASNLDLTKKPEFALRKILKLASIPVNYRIDELTYRKPLSDRIKIYNIGKKYQQELHKLKLNDQQIKMLSYASVGLQESS